MERPWDNRTFSLKHMAFLVVWWSLSLYTLQRVTQPFNLPGNRRPIARDTAQALPDNEFGAFSYVYTPENNSQPGSSVSFQHLKVTKAKLGLFRTALCKNVTIQQLTCKLYSYTQASPVTRTETRGRTRGKNARTPNPTGMDRSPQDALTADFAGFLEQLPRRLSALFDADRNVTFLLPDMSQTIGIAVDQFQFQWLMDEQEQLTIRSQRADFQADNAGQITLRGAVKIGTPSRMIQANHIVWNIDQQRFHVKGGCVSTIENQTYFERDLCLDTNLNVIAERGTTKKETRYVSQKIAVDRAF